MLIDSTAAICPIEKASASRLFLRVANLCHANRALIDADLVNFVSACTMSDLLLRTVVREDNATLAAIIRAVFEEYNAPKHGTVYSDATTDNLYELFQEKKSVLWGAELKRQIVGCCGVYPTPGLDKGCAELAKFYLLDKARGKGVGRALLLQCISSAREMGYKWLYLESLPEFSKAISMYEHSGFKAVDAPLGNSGHTSCNIWMIMEL